MRIGTDIVYTDEQGNYLIQGQLDRHQDAQQPHRSACRQADGDRLRQLPLKDAIVIKQGNGARKLAVFGDPNCGYCKQFERDLANVKDVTIYTFLYPILGPDSSVKARNIWCAKDSGKTWRAWMVDGVAPPKAAGKCDVAPLERNVAFGQKHRIRARRRWSSKTARGCPARCRWTSSKRPLPPPARRADSAGPRWRTPLAQRHATIRR